MSACECGREEEMASTACFLHHHAPSTANRIQSTRLVPINKPNLIVCKAQKQAAADENSAAVSRRMALTVLLGAAALGAKVAPADAAYGEAGKSSPAVSPTPVVVVADTSSYCSCRTQPTCSVSRRRTPTSCRTPATGSS